MSLGQNLEDVLARLGHDVEHFADVIQRHQPVKQVAHAVHEDDPWLAPAKRLVESLGSEANIFGSVSRGPCLRGPAKPVAHRLGVAVRTPGRDLRAARAWVPGRLRPLDPALAGLPRVTL